MMVTTLMAMLRYICTSKRAVYSARLQPDTQYVASVTCRSVTFLEHPAKLLYTLM
jgi:hypothetical protein